MSLFEIISIVLGTGFLGYLMRISFRFGKMFQKIENIEKDISGIKEEICGIKTDIKSLDRKFDDRFYQLTYIILGQSGMVEKIREVNKRIE